MEFFTAITESFAKGGMWMWLILFLQVVSVAIIIERVIFLYFSKKINQKDRAGEFEASIREGRLTDVKSKALAGANTVDDVVVAGVDAAMNWGGQDEIRGKMDEVLMETNSMYSKRIGFLAMLGNVGTLTGLLGTIVGMIQAFTAVSTANPAEKAAMLSSGISTAMNTTAYGLIMAIPALIMYAILMNRANQLTEDLNQGSLKVYNWLSYAFEPSARTTNKPSQKRVPHQAQA